ncbi:MAG: hypothetical protein HFE45_07210 [Oscillospiraceae bacterium]|nr:hypothetical protein [Oscillospiraceae bacterium]
MGWFKRDPAEKAAAKAIGAAVKAKRKRPDVRVFAAVPCLAGLPSASDLGADALEISGEDLKLMCDLAEWMDVSGENVPAF